jgi:hypothetical protein
MNNSAYSPYLALMENLSQDIAILDTSDSVSSVYIWHLKSWMIKCLLDGHHIWHNFNSVSVAESDKIQQWQINLKLFGDKIRLDLAYLGDSQGGYLDRFFWESTLSCRGEDGSHIAVIMDGSSQRIDQHIEVDTLEFANIPNGASLSVCVRERGMYADNLYRDYFLSDKYSDIHFTLQSGEYVPAHRIILSIRSSFFRNLLAKEQARSVISFTGISYVVFRIILEYLYTGDVSLFFHVDCLEELYVKSHDVHLPGLTCISIKYILNNLSKSTWKKYLAFGIRHKDNALIMGASQFVIRNRISVTDLDRDEAILLVPYLIESARKMSSDSPYFCPPTSIVFRI